MTTKITKVPQQGAAPGTEPQDGASATGGNTDHLGTGQIIAGQIRPYISVTVFQIAEPADPDLAFRLLERRVREHQSNRRELALVSDGVPTWATASGAAEPMFDEAAGQVWLGTGAPSWAIPDSPYKDVQHELSLCLRRRRFIAVHGSDSLVRAIRRWVDKSPRPPLRLVSAGTINACFIAGNESKNIWLRGIRHSSKIRPDSKTMAGPSVGGTLDPIADTAFRLSATRVALPEAPERVHVTGMLGSTPGEGKIWNRPSQDDVDFVMAVREILDLIEATAQAGLDVTSPYAPLATPVDGLTGVEKAYEFRCPPVDDIIAAGEISPDRQEAAERLQNVMILADPVPRGPDAILHVHKDGGSGVLRASVREDEGRAIVSIGYEGDQTDPETARQILRDLVTVGDFSIHYASGHAIFPDGVYQIRQETVPFQNWSFQDFTGYNLDQEKPEVPKGARLHDFIARSGDTSLFAWVVNTYNDGILLCDDGTGEIADFLYIGNDGKLSFIHVKGADSSSPRRRISASAYEVVVGQAVKNLVSLDRHHLAECIRRSAVTDPAVWSSGQRIRGRQDFLEMLDARDATDLTEIVVVQPHVSRVGLRSAAAKPDTLDGHRVKLLSSLLNAAQIACINSGAQLVVVGSN